MFNSLWQFPLAFNLPFDQIGEANFAFNWFNLSDCWTISLDTSNYDDITDVDIETFNAPRNDWGGVLGWFIHRKRITLNLVIKKDSEAELNSTIDILKRKLAKPEGTLRIMVNGETRSCKASLSSLYFNRDFSIKTILSNVVVNFEIMGSLVSDIPKYVTETDVSSPLVPFDILNESWRTDYKMYIIFKTVVDTDAITISMWGFTLQILQEIATNDILIINWIAWNVTLNGETSDFDWPIVKLEEGNNPISVEINGTYSADITLLYYENRW